MIDFLVIAPVSRFKVASIVGKYASGKYRELKEFITHTQGSYMEFESERRFVVNIDGETIHTGRIYFKAVPKGVNFVFPVGMEYFAEQ